MRAGAVKQEQQGLTLLLSSQKANVMDHVRCALHPPLNNIKEEGGGMAGASST